VTGTVVDAGVPSLLGTLGKRLRWARKQRGWARAAAFARAIDKEPRTVYRYERGDKLPKDATVEDICRVLRLNPAWLRHGRGAPFVEGLPGVETFLLTEQGQRLSPEVVRALREWPYDLLGMANPSVEEVRDVTVMVEMCLSHARQRRHGNGEEGA
jgi:transcriptional regulator with XRE-family HTH domain